jgi:hypothetical protein
MPLLLTCAVASSSMLGARDRAVTGQPTCSACKQQALGMSQTLSVASIAALTTHFESELMQASFSLSL